MKTQLNRLSLALVNAAMISVAGCGGGSSSDGGVSSDGSVIDPPGIRSGAVMGDQAIRNAVVCLDLDANNACGTDEPAAKTDDNGAYRLSYDPAVLTPAQVDAASLIAEMVPGTTIDAADPGVGNTAKPYVLKQVPGRSGQINPLTTLVAAGMAKGMSEAVARANVAAQLAIAPAKINNYQDDPVFDNDQVQDNARTMAQAAAAALEEGVAQVGDESVPVDASPGDLASLFFTDAANYFFRTLGVRARPPGAGAVEVVDARSGKTGGAATAHSVLYNQAYLSPNGWVRCDDTVPITVTRGNPSRSTFCNALTSVGYTVSSAVVGQTMEGVVSTLHSDSASNVINNGAAIDGLRAALGSSATFQSSGDSIPSIRTRTALNLTRPIFINSLNTDGRPQAEATTLALLIAAKPAAGVNLANGAGSLTLGLGSGNSRNLRVAFTGITNPKAGTVQFYECDLNSAQTVVSHCEPAGTGSYNIEEVPTTVGKILVMRFAGHAETIMNQTNLYAEVKDAPGVIAGNWVFRAREMKPSVDLNLNTTKRPNATAWAAMKTQLGL